jgi:hypothetical protein
MGLTNAHAVVIGVSQYRRVRPLSSVADAEGVAAALRDPDAGSYDPANVVLLQESDASREQILDELDRLGHRAGPGATALVYFSGHGGSWPGGDSYLLPIEGEWSSPDRLEATAISCRLLGDKLAAIRAERLTVILDCGHAAGFVQPRDIHDAWIPAIADRALEQLGAGPGRVVMAAPRGDGGPHVLAGARHGLFTEHLIAGLRGAAGGSDGAVRVLDLYRHVQRNVVARFPEQRSVLALEREDNYVVALCPGAARPAPPATAPSDFVYDVLLVYAPDDRDRGWVRVFLQLLEERGIRVCTEELDTEPGSDRRTELERLMSASQFTMPVLTPRFSTGRFQELQTALTHQLGLEDGIARLIPVVREPCAARLRLRSLVHLEMIRDESVLPGIERLVGTLRRQRAPRPRPR